MKFAPHSAKFPRAALALAALALAGLARVASAETGGTTAAAEDAKVEIKSVDAEKRVDVTVAGRPFLSYHYDKEKFFEKPISAPVLTVKGTPINRSLDVSLPGEATDHPHHQSLWFTYGDVDGVDYWNKAENPVRHIESKEVKVDGDKLITVNTWINKEAAPVFEENTIMTFGGGADNQWTDHDITLKALRDAKIGDSKEGAWGVRLNASLTPTKGTGEYVNADGVTKGHVWGKASAWTALRGKADGNDGKEDVTVAIFAHPSTVNFPPRWHARDYGLFTVNPFGRKSYDKREEELITPVAAGNTVHARFRLVIYDGAVSDERLAKDYAAYIAAAQPGS